MVVYDVEEQGAKNLKRHTQGLLNAHTTDGEKAWDLLVGAVLQSKAVKQRGDYKAMKLEQQQSAVTEIQKNWTADVGLAVMVYCRLSHARYDRLRQMMSKRYDKERDEYDRLKTEDGIDFPILPGLWAINRYKSMLTEDHGYTVSTDGKCATMNLRKQLASRVLEQGPDWFERHGLHIEVQVLGDGYRHFRRMTVVNLACRVLLVRSHLANAVTNMMTLAIWEGHEDKDSVEEYTEEVREVMEEVERDGLELNEWGETPSELQSLTELDGEPLVKKSWVKWRGGGDMKWIQTVLGVSGWGFSLWYFLSQKQFQDTASNNREGYEPKLKALEDCYHLAHRFFGKEKSFVCPGCKEEFECMAEIERDYKVEKRYTPPVYRSVHYGHNFGIAPTFDIAPLHNYICVLHFLLRLTGALWKRFIMSRIYTKAMAEKVLVKLRDDLHVYTGDIKVVSKSDKVTYDRMPSFTGEEAARIVEHWLELVSITCTDNEEFEGVRAIGEKFMEYFNILNKRILQKGEDMWTLTEEDKKARLNKKADALQVCGNEFLDLYVEGADPESITHYVVAMTTIIPEQSRIVELIDVSGQGLENVNQIRKNTLTNRRTINDSVLKESQGTKRTHAVVGRVEQLAKADICQRYVYARHTVRDSYYKRKIVKLGQEGAVLKIIKVDLTLDEEPALL